MISLTLGALVNRMISRILRNNLYGLTVSINELLIPGTLIEDHLSQYCVSLGVQTGDEMYPIYVPGSATLIRYQSRYFMICTRHQLAQTNLEDVCLMLPNGPGQTQCITSGGARWFEHCDDGDHQQIVVLDFTEPCEAYPILKPMFFDFRDQHSDMPVDSIVAFITYGYLTQRSVFDYENSRIAQTKGRVLSRFAKPGSDDALHVIEPIEPISFDPDGMSGGPTFFISQERSGHLKAHFAGITIRAGRTRIMLIKAGAVQGMLNTIVRDKTGI